MDTVAIAMLAQVEWSYTLRTVVLGSSMLGVIGGVLGSFALLRRQSLLGDALAHAALPGVCLAFLVAGRSPVGLLGGAAVTGLAGALLILAIVRTSRIKEDAAMGIVLSVFFGLGVMLLTFIQRSAAGNQAGLDKYLFGQPAALTADDLKTMGVVAVVSLLAVALLYKEFKLLTFDAAFAASLGRPTRVLDVTLTGLLVLAIVTGLQTVGVVLMVAALITPAAAARQWTDRLSVMLMLSAAIGAGAAIAGSLISGSWGVPTGPAIVLAVSAVLVVSLLLAPQRGIVWAWARHRALERRIRRENLLKDLYRLGEAAGDPRERATVPELMGVRGQGASQMRAVLASLQRQGLVERDHDRVRLTAAGGREAARVVRRHRLWEMFLSRRMDLPQDHVHRDAEAMEHALTDEAADRLSEMLGHPETDPHGRRIPRGEASRR